MPRDIASSVTLSRRDRAALTLALHYARAGRRPITAASDYEYRLNGAAQRALKATTELLARHTPDDATDAVYDALTDANATGLVTTRLLRARLALLLRAVLRADAGDFGPVRFTDAAVSSLPDGIGPEYLAWLKRAVETSSRRITPLWELARKATL